MQKRSYLFVRIGREISLQYIKMPRRYSRKARKTTGKGKPARQTQNKATVPKDMVVFGQGLPKRAMVTHKYRDVFSYTSTLGGIANYLWKANGIYDPNTTGGGHQPLYFDQFAALYDHWYVVGSKVRFRILPVPGNTTNIGVATFVNDDGTVLGTDITMVAEQHKAKMTSFGVNVERPQILTLNYSAKKTYGGTIVGNSKQEGSSSNDPTELSYYALSFQSLDFATSASINVEVEIDYIVVWTELRDMAAS